jgi:hypothetical protein
MDKAISRCNHSSPRYSGILRAYIFRDMRCSFANQLKVAKDGIESLSAGIELRELEVRAANRPQT